METTSSIVRHLYAFSNALARWHQDQRFGVHLQTSSTQNDLEDRSSEGCVRRTRRTPKSMSYSPPLEKTLGRPIQKLCLLESNNVSEVTLQAGGSLIELRISKISRCLTRIKSVSKIITKAAQLPRPPSKTAVKAADRQRNGQ
uniref:Uncharacterized protein n=1 Tax=Strigamia maritima TaxID=126957 RepID=T1J3C6_STRMM